MSSPNLRRSRRSIGPSKMQTMLYGDLDHDSKDFVGDLEMMMEENKKLNGFIKQNQRTIDEQVQEIEYLKKHAEALRVVNESRLEICEQLELENQELERNNARLTKENINAKKMIKAQQSAIEIIEARADKLQNKLDELSVRQKSLLKLKDSLDESKDRIDQFGYMQLSTPPRRWSITNDSRMNLSGCSGNDNDMTKVLEQLKDAQAQRSTEQKRVRKLKQELETVLQEHAQLEEQLNEWKSKGDYIKNLEKEVRALQNIRQENLCGRCFGSLDLDQVIKDDISSKMGLEEEYESSISEIPGSDIVFESDGPFAQGWNKHLNSQNDSPTVLSLHDELERSMDMNHGNFDDEVPVDQPAISSHQQQSYTGNNSKKKRLPKMAIPNDFSEAETCSSGFTEETSNKATQTENGITGQLLCTIAEGTDFRLSIYDDFNNFRSRFPQILENRQIFSKILKVFKCATAAKGDNSNNSSPNTTLKVEQNDFSVSIYSEDGVAIETIFNDSFNAIPWAVSLMAPESTFRSSRSSLSQSRGVSPVFDEICDNKNQVEENISGIFKSDFLNTSIKQLANNTRRQPLEYLQIQVRKRSSISMKLRSEKFHSDSAEIPNTPDVVPTRDSRFLAAPNDHQSSFLRKRVTEGSCKSAELNLDNLDNNGLKATIVPDSENVHKLKQS